MKKATVVQHVFAFLLAILVAVPTAKAQDVEPIQTVPQLERAIQGTWVSDEDEEVPRLPRLALGGFEAQGPFAMVITIQSGDSTRTDGGIGSLYNVDSNSVTFSAEIEELGKEYLCRFELTDRSLTCGFIGEDESHFYVKRED